MYCFKGMVLRRIQGMLWLLHRKQNDALGNPRIPRPPPEEILPKPRPEDTPLDSSSDDDF